MLYVYLNRALTYTVIGRLLGGLIWAVAPPVFTQIAPWIVIGGVALLLGVLLFWLAYSQFAVEKIRAIADDAYDLAMELAEISQELADENQRLREGILRIAPLVEGHLEKFEDFHAKFESIAPILEERLKRLDELEAELEDLERRREVMRGLRRGRPKGRKTISDDEWVRLMRNLECWLSYGGTMQEFANENKIPIRTLQRWRDEWVKMRDT